MKLMHVTVRQVMHHGNGALCLSAFPNKYSYAPYAVFTGGVDECVKWVNEHAPDANLERLDSSELVNQLFSKLWI